MQEKRNVFSTGTHNRSTRTKTNMQIWWQLVFGQHCLLERVAVFARHDKEDSYNGVNCEVLSTDSVAMTLVFTNDKSIANSYAYACGYVASEIQALRRL